MPMQELLTPRDKDIGGGFTVRRLLPTHQRQAVGPFIFFDHFGPVTTRPGDNHDGAVDSIDRCALRRVERGVERIECLRHREQINAKR